VRAPPNRRAAVLRPELVGPADACHAEASYDLAVATKQLADGQPVVTNDWQLDPPERLLVVTGANQGGKTTFARAFGQLHHLAESRTAGPRAPSHGGPARPAADPLRAPGAHRDSLRGKLEDELVRVHDLLTQASADSVVFLNETFSSTTLQDARELGGAVLRRLERLGARGVFVTFVDELSSVGRAR
jgi:DNA mismatch repair protein MutS